VNETLYATVTNNELDLTPLFVFEIAVLDDEVVTYLAVVHTVGPGLIRPC
jgi:hypothetical protein